MFFFFGNQIITIISFFSYKQLIITYLVPFFHLQEFCNVKYLRRAKSLWFGLSSVFFLEILDIHRIYFYFYCWGIAYFFSTDLESFNILITIFLITKTFLTKKIIDCQLLFCFTYK